MALQQVGRIHAALFSDSFLFMEVQTKASFWLQQNYFGVDITRLHTPATNGYFSQVRGRGAAECRGRSCHCCLTCGVWPQVVVDAIDPGAIVSACVSKTFDFGTVQEKELHDIRIPIELQAGKL